MLPCLDRLPLDPALYLKQSAVRTGGYIVVDQAEQVALRQKLEDDESIDPITQEQTQVHTSVFRVQARTANADDSPRYSYWDPRVLWQWVQRPESGGRMPNTNEPVWFEDWWSLYYTFGAETVPQWAYTLEKRSAATVSSVPAAAPNAAPPPPRGFAAPRAPRSNNPFENTPQPYGHHDTILNETDRMNLERERYRKIQNGLPGIVPAPTGIIGRFWLHGTARDNPTAEQIRAGLQASLTRTVREEREFAMPMILVRLEERGTDALFGPATPMMAVEYELLGLTNEQGSTFFRVVRAGGGNNEPSVNDYFKGLFDLPSMPMLKPRDLPAWAGFAAQSRVWGRLDLGPAVYAEWGRHSERDRERYPRHWR